MIRVETDTLGSVELEKHVELDADFTQIMKNDGDVQEFTTDVWIELKSAVLAAIVAAHDEYLRVIQSKSKKQMPVELKNSLKETILGFVEDIDTDEIDEFREMVKVKCRSKCNRWAKNVTIEHEMSRF